MWVKFAIAGIAAMLLPQAVWADETDQESKADSETKSSQVEIETAGLKSGCFYPRDVNNWDALNRQYLIVYAPNKSRSYLVSFSPPSVDLRSASTIGFEGRDRICGKTGERLVVGRGRGMGYMVLDVWRLDRATVDRMLEQKANRDSPEAIPPGESPGAEPETAIGDSRSAAD